MTWIILALALVYLAIGWHLFREAIPGAQIEDWPLVLWVLVRWPWKAKEWRL